jgi:hypothetical protein
MALVERLPEIRHRPLDIAIALAIVVIGLPVMIIGAIGGGAYLYFFKLSPPVAIPEPKGISVARTSHIYAADGSLIATLRGATYRVPIDYRDMPLHLVDAAVVDDDGRGAVRVVLHECLERGPDLLGHHAAHAQHVVLDLAHLAVQLAARRMKATGLGALGRRLVDDGPNLLSQQASAQHLDPRRTGRCPLLAPFLVHRLAPS